MLQLEKVRVSIIEDNKVIRDNVAKFIGFHEEFELGYIYSSAGMFLDAIDSNTDGSLHLLLLDLGLPDMFGIDAILLAAKRLA